MENRPFILTSLKGEEVFAKQRGHIAMSRHSAPTWPHSTYFHKELIFKVSDVAFEAIEGLFFSDEDDVILVERIETLT